MLTGRRELRRFDDRDGAPLAACAELDSPVLRGEDRVVAPNACPWARLKARAALADDDHPGLDLLAGKDLHAEHLRVRVAPVARGTESLLVCHFATPPSSFPASSPPSWASQPQSWPAPSAWPSPSASPRSPLSASRPAKP